MKELVLGIFAHVDAGKTTLSESLLYLSGKTQRLGRVDNKDAYLDTHELERERGITIFSKQAIFEIENTKITLLDTPGHVDFSAEMERTLQVLDYAILVISASDGVQGHTSTLWHLFSTYKVPVFLFVNKMDRPETSRDSLLAELKTQLDEGIIGFDIQDDEFFDELAMSDEDLLEKYLTTGEIKLAEIRKAIAKRQVFPCFFGSALKLDGIEDFMQALANYTNQISYPEDFAARAFKISRDEQGNRLAHLKVTGGKLKVRDLIGDGDWEEKINQIRIYSGEKYFTVDSVKAGTVCAVTGLSQVKAGDGLGNDANTDSYKPILEPVLSYKVTPSQEQDYKGLLLKLSELEEEIPELQVVWDELLQEIQVQIMGDVQIEILQSLILERFGIEVFFDTGRVLYKETIKNTVEGVGHFEPLRHYAEVHLLLEPRPLNSGLKFKLNCSEDVLAKNWQRLILSHLQEKSHKGVLTGSNITDLTITVVSGRAHNTHTEGGDFREATYRAVRQGLKEATSILLEPYYNFSLDVPEETVGRAIADLEKMNGTWKISETKGNFTCLTGSVPVVNIRNYHKEVVSFTRGLGRLILRSDGYKPCHNQAEVLQNIAYDSEKDLDNPTGSIFCTKGAGYYVPWDKVKEHMHLESYLKQDKEAEDDQEAYYSKEIGQNYDDQGEYAFLNTSANIGKRIGWNRRKLAGVGEKDIAKPVVSEEPKETYLLVDGYNVIHAWSELKELAEDSMDAARVKLLDILSSYRGIKNINIIVVFDAYGVVGHLEETVSYHNIFVVYTKEAQTADEYIEKFAYDNRIKHNVVVATSDALQQVIIRGAGSALLSARELKEEIEISHENAKRSYQARQRYRRTNLEEVVPSEVKKRMDDLT